VIVYSHASNATKQMWSASLSVLEKSRGKEIQSCVQIDTHGLVHRPPSRRYVKALEGKILSLEQFIMKLESADLPERAEMLARFRKASSRFQSQFSLGASSPEAFESTNSSAILSRTGHLIKLGDRNAAEYYGATSVNALLDIIPLTVWDYTSEEIPVSADISSNSRINQGQ